MPREEFVVAVFIEPGAFDIEERETRQEACQGEGIDAELGDGFVGARVGLVIEDVNGAVARLQEVNVTGDASWALARGGVVRIDRLFWDDSDAVFGFESGDVGLPQPNRDFDRDRAAVVSQHETLQLGMSIAVGAASGNDQRRHIGGGVLLFGHNKAIER